MPLPNGYSGIYIGGSKVGRARDVRPPRKSRVRH